MEPEIACEKCHRGILGKSAVWLEMRRDLTLHIPEQGEHPDSQGEFSFGVDCAERILKEGLSWGEGGGAWGK